MKYFDMTQRIILILLKKMFIMRKSFGFSLTNL